MKKLICFLRRQAIPRLAISLLASLVAVHAGDGAAQAISNLGAPAFTYANP